MSIDLFKMFNDGQRIRRQDILRRFSTSEQFTGDYWVDGKKIYQRTWSVGARSGNSTATISLSSANIDQIWFDMGNSYYIESGGASDTGKIYQKSYNLGTINAFRKIENIANFDRNIRYEFSMRANDKISGVNGVASTDLFVTTGGDVYINTNGNTRYDVVLTLWYTKN